MIPSDPNHLLRSLLVGGSLGVLIGLERQWDEQFRHHHLTVLAGMRTFTLWALFGVLCAWFSQKVHVLFFVAGFAAMVLWLTLYLQSRSKSGEDLGFTTGIAGMITFLVGGLVFWEEEKVALVLAVSVIILLALKPVFYRFTGGITVEDVRTALKFAAITGVILPLVPDAALGPYGAFNPYTIWLMVVLVSGVGFVGYVAVRILGEHNGIAIAGFLGGLVSSNASTLAMSRRSAENPAESRDCSLAILLSCTVMLGRVAILVGVVSGKTLMVLWPSLVIIALPGMIWCLWRLLHGGAGGGKAGDLSHYENPLRLWPAFQFGIIYAVIIFLVKMTISLAGNAGLLAVSGLSGLVDLNAITVSLSQMTGAGAIHPATAATGILLAILSGTCINAFLILFYGSPVLRKEVLTVLGVSVLAVIASCFWLMR